MIDHLIIVETQSGGRDVLTVALADLDFSGKLGLISLAEQECREPQRKCHSVFLYACQQLEDFIAERKVRPAVSRVIAVVDSADWMALRPLSTAGDYSRERRSPLLALLILTFPEVLWVFVHLGGADGTPPFVQRSHLLEKWLQPGAALKIPPIEPLMDVTGLRDHVRKLAAEMTGSKGATLPFRPEWAVSMDDESAYAYFNAYIQYRHGFRAVSVCSWATADYLLGKKAPDSNAPMVSFEDLFMSFPDVPASNEAQVSLSDFTKRDAAFPLLAETTHRTILTSGHRQPGSCSIDLEMARRHAKQLFKPIGGMFRIWKESGLWEILRRLDPKCRAWVGGYAPGYHPGVPIEPRDLGLRHSAPGALLAVAEVLIGRVERVKKDMITVEDVIFGAVLATDAFELLASRTPTLSLDALALKHELETKAECCFNGVQNHFDVRSRLRKIQKAVDLLSKWYDPRHQDISCWNAEAVVLTRIKSVFREYEQFDEEMFYATRSRTLHRRLWFRQHLGKIAGTRLRYVNPLYWLAWYVGFLLKGIPTFVVLLIVWIGVLTCGFHKVETTMQNQSVPVTVAVSADEKERDEFVAQAGPWTRALTDSFSCMVSVGAPLHAKVVEGSGKMVSMAYLLSCLGMGIGFLHLGIFISHVYSIASRK